MPHSESKLELTESADKRHISTASLEWHVTHIILIITSH